MTTQSPACLSDETLLRQLAEIVRDSRRVDADLLGHIAEVDARRLFLREACPSMFVYCVERLHLSEPETALRIVVARASRRHPVLLDLLREGRLHLSGIALLAPHLTAENRDEVLARAAHLSKRQIEELVATIAPRPDAPTLVRRLPVPRAEARRPGALAQAPVIPMQHRPDDVAASAGAGDVAAADPAATAPAVAAAVPPAGAESVAAGGASAAGVRPSRSDRIEPLAAARYRVQFTASAALKEKLDRLRALMRGSVPDGDLATLIEDAVTEKIARLEARRLGAAKKPRRDLAQSDLRAGSRHIAAAVKRAVRERDGDRCAYVDAQGHRCTARSRLQFHHRHPRALGGDRSPSNIALLCQAHNLLEGRADFGGHGRLRLDGRTGSS